MNIEEYKKQSMRTLLKIVNHFLLRHDVMVNRARMNGNWIDWEYDIETDTYKRIN